MNWEVKHGETLKLTASWIYIEYFEGLTCREAHTLLKWTYPISCLKFNEFNGIKHVKVLKHHVPKRSAGSRAKGLLGGFGGMMKGGLAALTGDRYAKVAKARQVMANSSDPDRYEWNVNALMTFGQINKPYHCLYFEGYFCCSFGHDHFGMITLAYSRGCYLSRLIIVHFWFACDLLDTSNSQVDTVSGPRFSTSVRIQYPIFWS